MHGIPNLSGAGFYCYVSRDPIYPIHTKYRQRPPLPWEQVGHMVPLEEYKNEEATTSSNDQQSSTRASV